MLKRGEFDKEPREVKEHILEEIYENDYYDYYGICDPMRDLANAIFSNKEENLKRAEIMMKAVEIATQAIQKCQKDQTTFFLFLLQDAKDRGDEAAFKKMMQSAHRRRSVKSEEVDAKFS